VRRAAVLALACAAVAAVAPAAGATNECRGLQVCVPVAGPWVVSAGTTEVRYQLACPRRFVVGGLDAELSSRNVDVAFRGALGSPVNPGITTTTSAVFLGRLLASGHPAVFRPHIGCIPAQGGGRRFPTAFAPGRPLAPAAVELAVRAGVHRVVKHCPAGRRMAGASSAVGIYTAAAPGMAEMLGVNVVQHTFADRVELVVRAKPSAARRVVQVDLDCVGAP
jgi:hypothetical protein